MPTIQTKDLPKRQQQEQRSWWSWGRSKTSRETTPAPDSATESSSKTADTKDTVIEVKEEDFERTGKKIAYHIIALHCRDIFPNLLKSILIYFHYQI